MSSEEIKNSSEADNQELQNLDGNAETILDSEGTITLTKTDNNTVKNSVNEFDNNEELYKQVLEKLGINNKEDIQEKSMKGTKEINLDKIQQLEKSQSQIETTIKQDFDKIQKLINSHLIDSVQGQNLKQQVLKKAFDMLVQTEKIKRDLSSSLNSSTDLNENNVFEEFSQSNPDFFNPDGRKDVLEYLKSNNVGIGKDELSKISEIIKLVEKSAIERYLKEMSYEKGLRDSNEVAKQRLTANAQKSTLSGNLSRPFTRDQIGKMSSAEFNKYEPLIMEQLKKGLIK